MINANYSKLNFLITTLTTVGGVLYSCFWMCKLVLWSITLYRARWLARGMDCMHWGPINHDCAVKYLSGLGLLWA